MNHDYKKGQTLFYHESDMCLEVQIEEVLGDAKTEKYTLRVTDIVGNRFKTDVKKGARIEYAQSRACSAHRVGYLSDSP
ncbi:MAG: hypothetical protein HZB67_00335 [Candidatus Aenigmarchaeota archaeon]|nr:hypothetical protein [Candidatus Aenigmarchaeota archaeon]